jgi:hypothetical protein
MNTMAPLAPVTVRLAMTPEMHAMILRGTTYLEVANAYEITDHETAQQAANELTTIKSAIAELAAGKKGFVQPARDIIANAEKWFDPGIEGYEKSEALLKTRLLEWSERERARIAAERAKQEAEAEAARAAAEATGNAEDAMAAAVAGSAIAAPEEMARIAGFTTRKNWKAQLMPGISEEQAKAMILAEAGARPELLALFDLNMGRLDKLAKAQEAAMSVPGYVARNVPIAAGSRR